MKDRRRRLAKSIANQEGCSSKFDKNYDKLMNDKSIILQKYTTVQLEKDLKTSTKNIALELVEILMSTGTSKGILPMLERRRFKYFTKMMKNTKHDYITSKPINRKDSVQTASMTPSKNLMSHESTKMLYRVSKPRSTKRDYSKETTMSQDFYSNYSNQIVRNQKRILCKNPSIVVNNYQT